MRTGNQIFGDKNEISPERKYSLENSEINNFDDSFNYLFIILWIAFFQRKKSVNNFSVNLNSAKRDQQKFLQ